MYHMDSVCSQFPVSHQVYNLITFSYRYTNNNSSNSQYSTTKWFHVIKETLTQCNFSLTFLQFIFELALNKIFTKNSHASSKIKLRFNNLFQLSIPFDSNSVNLSSLVLFIFIFLFFFFFFMEFTRSIYSSFFINLLHIKV